MKLRVGFLGLGAMGLSHLKTLHVDFGAEAEAVAVCARSPDRVQKALAIAPQATVFRDEAALIHSDLDAVVVSTPNCTHVPLALEALRAGKHLFLEKPVGISRADCRQLVEAASNTDRVVLVGHELRYSPLFQKIKALVDAGEIGRPWMVWCREFRGPFQKKSGDWIQDRRQSGGALVDKNCHHFDLMNWWVGSRPRRVAAFGGNAVHRVIEGEDQVLDHATVSFEYANGVRGTLQLCMFAREFPDEELEMGIVGSAGSLETRVRPPRASIPRATSSTDLDLPPRPVESSGALEILQWKRGQDRTEPKVHPITAKFGAGWGGHLGYAEIHEAFLRAMRTGERLLTNVRDCVDGTLLAIAAEESIRCGKTVEIE